MGDSQVERNPTEMALDSAIAFDEPVDCEFFGGQLKKASRALKASDKRLTIKNSEAIRRSYALIGAILTGRIDIVE